MSKRQKFLATSGLLSLGFIVLQFLDNQYKFLAIFLLALSTIGLFYWALLEGLNFDATLLTLILPLYFTVGVGLFWFLLPATFFARLPVVIFYGAGVYVLSLTANIFTVAAIRTIALVRAAKGVGFVLTLVTSFLIFDAILSLKTNIFITGGAVAVFCLPLYLQGLWTSDLGKTFSKEILISSGIFSLVMGEIALILYFWPVTVVVGSLFLTAAVYMLLGLAQARQEGRLFSATVREYLLVGVLVFIGMFLATHWRG